MTQKPDRLDEVLDQISEAELAILYAAVLDLRERVEALDDVLVLAGFSAD